MQNSAPGLVSTRRVLKDALHRHLAVIRGIRPRAFNVHHWRKGVYVGENRACCVLMFSTTRKGRSREISMPRTGPCPSIDPRAVFKVSRKSTKYVGGMSPGFSPEVQITLEIDLFSLFLHGHLCEQTFCFSCLGRLGGPFLTSF